jgi:hypothetical protein
MLVNNNDDCTTIVEHTRYLAMIVQPLYNHRYFSNDCTIIVQPSYNHRTMIAKLIAKVERPPLGGEVERWRRDGGARASAGPAGVFAW